MFFIGAPYKIAFNFSEFQCLCANDLQHQIKDLAVVKLVVSLHT